MHLYTTATEITPADVIFYLKNLQIDPSSFAFVTHLCLEQVWTDSEEKGIKKGKIQKNTGVDAHMKANSI